MTDILIRNVTIIDGTGAPATLGDVTIDDGRIAAVSPPADAAAATDAEEVVDGTGLVLTPGFIDPHTHFDAQLLWDPYASPSNLHGITTVISGNCGFTLAPITPEDTGWTLEMMAEVEGMPLAALAAGVRGGWTTFAEYLDELDGNLGVNAGFLVGHCQLRRYVMGADGDVAATPEQTAAMAAELRAAIEAGGMGFSSTQSFSHSARSSPTTTARRSSTSPTGVSRGSPTRRSSASPTCRCAGSERSTGTCSPSTRATPAPSSVNCGHRATLPNREAGSSR